MSLKSFLLSFRMSQRPSDAFWQKFDAIIRSELSDLNQSNVIELNSNESIHLYYSNAKPISLTVRYYDDNDGGGGGGGQAPNNNDGGQSPNDCGCKLISIHGEMTKNCGPVFYSNNLIDKLKARFNELMQQFDDNHLDSNQMDRIEAVPMLKRNNPVPLYFLSSDGRVLEYDFDQTLVNETTPFQNIKIFRSPTLGNCLLLDDMQNLAESDLPYTHGLMNFGKNSYKDKEILILGGGDGALLHELLKESPKFVTMIDIDEKVMIHCRQYLRGACGDTLDTFDGANYKIIVGDCLEYMRRYIDEKRTFDVVFNDLTDIPISTEQNRDYIIENNDKLWSFIRQILQLSMKILNTDGLYLNHAIGVNCKQSLHDYESLLNELSTNNDDSYVLSISSHSRYVPSFMEDWVFYQIQKQQQK